MGFPDKGPCGLGKGRLGSQATCFMATLRPKGSGRGGGDSGGNITGPCSDGIHIQMAVCVGPCQAGLSPCPCRHAVHCMQTGRRLPIGMYSPTHPAYGAPQIVHLSPLPPVRTRRLAIHPHAALSSHHQEMRRATRPRRREKSLVVIASPIEKPLARTKIALIADARGAGRAAREVLADNEY